MKYPSNAKQLVELSVTKWFRKGLYPEGWDAGNQMKGAHAECAAFIARFGDPDGIVRWYTDAKAKREEFGNDPKQRDGYDLIGKEADRIDAKWVPDYDQIWVTESTHKASTYTALAGVKFNEAMDEFEIYYISRADFDAVADAPRSNKLRVRLSECRKVDEL